MSRRVTLTFDNGPTLDCTPFVLSQLAQRNLLAYFCVVGRQLKKSPDHVDLALQTKAAGHRLINHSLTHGTALGDDPSSQHAAVEIGDMHHLMQQTLGDWGEPWFRPFGRGGQLGPHVFSHAALDQLQHHKYSVLLWNSVPRDWEDPRGWVATALSHIESKQHSVVVLHDLPTRAMEQLPVFLDEVCDSGFEVTLDLPTDCVPIRNGVTQWSTTELTNLVSG